MLGMISQYDKIYKHEKGFVSMTKYKSVWQNLGFCLKLCGKVCFFMACHAILTAHNDK